MNRNIWAGIYAASFALFLLTLIGVGLFILLGMDQIIIIRGTPFFAAATIGVLAYLQFLIVQTIFSFMLLAKMWGSIQDGVTPITVGKAIGFLFIPFFSIYWIFVAWGGFPKQYNDYVECHKLNAPRLSSGVYVALPIMMLVSGLLIFPILALPVVFALVITQTADAVNNLTTARGDRQKGIALPTPPATEPKSKLIPTALGGLIAACLVFCLAFLLFAVHNLKPAANDNLTPATVGKFERSTVFPQGSIFGLRTTYDATYKISGDKQTQYINYKLADYTREANATDDYDYRKTCYGNAVKKEVIIKNKKGDAVGEISICNGTIPNFKIGKKVVSLSSSSAASLGFNDFLQFFLALPFNSEIDATDLNAFAKTIAAPPALPSSPSSPDVKPDIAKTPVTAADQADFTLTAEEFDKDTDGANREKGIKKYAGKIIEIAGRYHKSFAADSVYLNGAKYPITLKVAAETQPKIGQMNEDERLTFKCRGDDNSYRTGLMDCVMTESKGIMSPDETPEFTLTAADYYKKHEVYAGKIVELSGKVRDVINERRYLAIGKNDWIECKSDAENSAPFAALVAGQDVKFKGLGSHYGALLDHCIVVSQ